MHFSSIRFQLHINNKTHSLYISHSEYENSFQLNVKTMTCAAKIEKKSNRIKNTHTIHNKQIQSIKIVYLIFSVTGARKIVDMFIQCSTIWNPRNQFQQVFLHLVQWFFNVLRSNGTMIFVFGHFNIEIDFFSLSLSKCIILWV